MAITYKYRATSDEAYHSLAAYAVTLSVPVSLFPHHKTIAAPEQAADELGDFIDKECLDIIISSSRIDVDDINKLLADPTSDTSILRDIAESFQAEMKASAELYKVNLEKAIEKATGDKDVYYNYWMNAEKKYDRIHKQMEAISALMNSIFPKE